MGVIDAAVGRWLTKKEAGVLRPSAGGRGWVTIEARNFITVEVGETSSQHVHRRDFTNNETPNG